MAYVASPSHNDSESRRQENLEQCLDTAKRHLDETSHASDSERQQILISSAVEAGWGEEEVRAVIEKSQDASARVPPPGYIGLVSGSSFLPDNGVDRRGE